MTIVFIHRACKNISMAWKKGQSGNPDGNKSRKAALLREAFKSLMTLEEAKKLVAKAITQAHAGDPALLKSLLPYCEQILPRSMEHSGKNDGDIKVRVNLT